MQLVLDDKTNASIGTAIQSEGESKAIMPKNLRTLMTGGRLGYNVMSYLLKSEEGLGRVGQV